MTDDLIARLRSVDVSWSETGEWCAEAADRIEALCRVIEQHEAFKQEVSDAVEDYCGYVPPDSPCHPITRFIIAKPDPLVEAVEDWINNREFGEGAASLHAALAARGLKIVEDKA